MSRRTRDGILPALAAAGAALVGTGALAAPPLIEVDKPFPLVPLPLVGEAQPTDEAALVSIDDFRGRKTVVHIFAGW